MKIMEHIRMYPGQMSHDTKSIFEHCNVSAAINKPHCGFYEGNSGSQSPQGDGPHQGWVSSLLGREN